MHPPGSFILHFMSHKLFSTETRKKEILISNNMNQLKDWIIFEFCKFFLFFLDVFNFLFFWLFYFSRIVI